jgi:hypothetical protein
VTRYGYFLSSEEYEPTELVRQARLAEQAGFEAFFEFFAEQVLPRARGN